MGWTLGDILRRHARERGEQPMLTYGPHVFTYRDMDERSNRVAQGLLAEGVGPQDRIAMVDKNGPEYFEILLGGAKANVVAVAVNCRLAPAEVALIVADAKPRLFVGEKMFIDPLASIDNFTLPPTMFLESGGEDCFDRLIDAQPDRRPDFSPHCDDVVVQLYTSGTTGLPKGVLLSNRCYFEVGEAGLKSGVVNPRFENETIMHALPHFHIAGVNFGFMGWSRSMPVIQHRQFDPAAIVKEAQSGLPPTERSET